jgi:hypothetical protein
VFAHGSARFLGSTGAIHLNQPITGMAATPSGNGYWLVASDGGIFAFGDAGFYGSTGAIKLNRPITGMASTPTGHGYWLVASDGGIFAFGDAKFFGSTGAIKLNKPITGMAPTPTGNGYWLTASDGGIFAFGDARFFGSTGAMRLNQPIAAMAPNPTGSGYWLAAADGGIFSFGNAPFYGAAPSRPAAGPRTVVGMVPTATGAGYWQASTSGELLAFGDAPDLGGASGLTHPIVALAAFPGSGLAPVDDSGAAGDTGDHGAAPGTPTTTTPVRPGPTTTTSTTSPASPTSSSTTTTTVPYVPPAGGPRTFSSTARVTWGTPLDPNRSGYAQEVDAMVEVGNTVFVAGQFTNVADPNGKPATPPQPFLVALDVNTGAPVAGSRFNANANPDGPINALAVSPDGHRLYVGGKFTTVGGKAIRRLAALDVDTGLWDPTFNPPTPSAYINALALSHGRLYVGGAFSTLTPPAPGTAVARPQLAALDAASGTLIDGFVPPTNYGGVFETHTGKPVEDQPGTYNPGVVDAIAVTADGATVMVGGNFLHFGTAPADDPNHQHGGLVALDGTTGALTLWQPVSKRPVFGLTVWPGDGNTVFTAAGGAGGVVQAFRPGFSTSPKWTGHVDGDARGVAATTTRVYLVGHYDHEVPNAKDPCLQLSPQPPDGHLGISCPDGDPHRHLAAFDAKTGNVDPTFTAQADTNEGPSVAYIGAGNLYVGGNFLRVSDTPGSNYRSQPGLAVYPAVS